MQTKPVDGGKIINLKTVDFMGENFQIIQNMDFSITIKTIIFCAFIKNTWKLYFVQASVWLIMLMILRKNG